MERSSFSVGDLGRYPLFAPEFIEFLQRVMPRERHAELVFSIVVTARKPQSAPVGRMVAESERRMPDPR